MVRHASEKDIERLANFLKFKKDRGERVGLFLGHRAGVLYNDKLYEALKNHITIADDLRNLLRRDSLVARELSKMIRDLYSYADLSAPDRFKNCYKFLGKYFSEPSIHSIFSEVLAPTQNREEDKLIAELINAEFFDTIFTTNFDTSLEDNCDSLGMIQNADYELVIYKANENITLKKEGSRGGKIIKVFGDFNARKYNIVCKEFNLETNQYLKKILLSELVKDVVVVGYDPTWDGPVERAFQVRDAMTNGTLWFVNDKTPSSKTHFARILREPTSKCIVGSLGNYRTFLYELSGFIEGKASWKPKSQIALPPAHTHDPIRKKAFISYSHKDKGDLDKLQVKLKGYLHVENENDDLDIRYDVWDDTKIPLSADWKKEIKKALIHAKLAVLLVSDNFLSSEFIRECELPVLYEAADAGEVQIVSIVLNPCAFNKTKLAGYQAINSDTEPLMGMDPYKQDQKWYELAEHIYNVLKS